MKAAFSSLVLVPSVMWMSSQKLASHASVSDLPPQNQSSDGTRVTMIAVTPGSLPRIVVDRRLTSAATVGLSRTFWCGVDTVTVISGMGSLHWVEANLAPDEPLRNAMTDDISDNNATSCPLPRHRRRARLRAGRRPAELHPRRAGRRHHAVRGQPQAQAAGGAARPAPGRAHAALGAADRRRRGIPGPGAGAAVRA